ncbi:hypothetical protein [Heyndrickxia oleronia]|jgi:hypothetical protein|uniref:hypothetical protein n=1 Tax=Heyndrickxia oleronia TaxID=38875 RepID=UPI000A68744E|nr:hypothetical protein [Heyndrickxia oleronia]MCI1591875.1 hypothetical protein [Heyndrickxia oleronia]MCI1614532.1 hypothetical protein [Heyndrickxia oleronia]MCI1743365.1 hypothetical protein [Heyndrickxia oleronia]MCI1762360.1 hypothetical protein [Heyndrickxia oleronia]MCM3455790.1 hypothetical protein [Heyndrickxia oleronia]
MKLEDKKQKKNKVQRIYRSIKQRKQEEKYDGKIGTLVVSISIFLWFLLIILNAIFDL